MLDSALRLGDFALGTRRVLTTLGLLIVYRFGFVIPIPGLSPEFLTAQKDQGAVLGLLSVFSGGAIGQTAIFALALLPWITASISEKLVLRLSARIRALSTGTARSRKTIARWKRGAVLPIAFVQGLAIYLGVFARHPEMIDEPLRASPVVLGALVVGTLAAGSMLVLWLSDKIDELGVGHGALVICAAGLLARMPHAVLQLPEAEFWRMLPVMLAVWTAVLIVLVIVWNRLDTRHR
jgi:preprotein translocase subunit SecY